MIDYHTFQQIRHLREREGLTMAQIAASVGGHWQTVSKWEKRTRYERRKPALALRRPSKLEPFKSTIVRLLHSHAFTAGQLLPRLREQGYDGGSSILKDFVRVVRPTPKPAFLTLHFAPGQCAQVDWGSWGTLRVGATRRALSFFVMVLCWSRRLYLEFTYGRSLAHWLACHARAFEYFGGSAAELMCDNTKTAVLARPPGAPPVLHPAYVDLANHYGCTIKPCAPRRANEKGRVESAVGYVKKNFLAGLARTDLASLNAAARLWLDQVANVRVHGETHRTPRAMFAEESPKLRPLPAHPFDAAVVTNLSASSRCRVTVDTYRYSVPAACASAQLALKLYAGRLRLFAGEKLVTEHLRCLLLMPIFEADFNEGSFGYRPGRNAHQALDAIARNLLAGRHEIIDADLSDYFGTIPHAGLLRLVARRASDGSILGLTKRFLKAPIVEDADGKRRISPNDRGTPQGGNLGPLRASLYLNSLDHGVNRQSELDAQIVRYADDFVLLCRPGHAPALYERLKVYLAAKGLTLNAAKTRRVDMRAGGHFRFLGFEVSWRKSDRSGRWYPHVEPSRKAQQNLRANIRRELNRWTRHRSSVETVRCVNRIVRGWGQHFHHGQSHQTFARLGDWMRERFRSWVWQKHGCKHSRYGFFTNARLHGQYGLWQLPLDVPYRRSPSGERPRRAGCGRPACPVR